MFGRRIMDNIVALNEELSSKTYRHGPYEDFKICDPKPRHIHKASLRDRLVHHAIYRILYPFFDRTFIADSFSCRNNKGTHAALYRFQNMAMKVSRNNTRTCWVLKCDIQKFFASIDHGILLEILRRRIPDVDILWLLKEVIESFATTPIDRHCEQRETISDQTIGFWSSQNDDDEIATVGTASLAMTTSSQIGLPLGNLTSQLFANITMNEFDLFVKHQLTAKYYIRYADDFVFLSDDRDRLESLASIIRDFLADRLGLMLHPKKIFIKTIASGVDFLGWVHFPDHRVLRTSTKRRMMRRIAEHSTEGTLDSYLGLLSHGNAYGLELNISMQQWLLVGPE